MAMSNQVVTLDKISQRLEEKERMEDFENSTILIGLESYVCLVGDNHMEQVRHHFDFEVRNGLEIINAKDCGFFKDPRHDWWMDQVQHPLLARLTRVPQVGIYNKKISQCAKVMENESAESVDTLSVFKINHASYKILETFVLPSLTFVLPSLS